MSEQRVGPGAHDGGGGGGGEEAGGAGLWSGSTGPTGPGSAGGTSAALPCRRRSGNSNRRRRSQNRTCSEETGAKGENTNASTRSGKRDEAENNEM